MGPQANNKGKMLFGRACKELDSGNVLAALSYIEAALEMDQNPAWYSLYGFCIAKERGHLTKGFEYCRKAIENDPQNSEHYLFLARIHLIAKNKQEAISALRQGLLLGDNRYIVKLLDELGTRKPLLFKGLDRNNPVNKYLGVLLSRLGFR